MFVKNEFRSAYAGASASSAQRSYRRGPAQGVTYDAGETEDFNSFHNTAGRPEGARPTRQAPPAGRPQRKNNNQKALIIAIVAAVALILLLALVIGLALGKENHITYEDNAFIAYADDSNTYHVLANGKSMDVEFEGDVELVCAADNSFAYAVDNGPDGYNVYLLDGKDIIPMTTTPVDDILAYATLTPGFVAKEPNDFRLYTEKGDERIVKRDAEPEKFFISADASTVVYTAIPTASDANAERRMYIYQNESAVPIKSSTPVGVSNYGDYVFATRSKDGVTDLYVITTKDAEAYQIEKSTGFAEIVATNVKGNEVLFRTFDGTQSNSYIYRFKKNGAGTTYSIGARYMSPVAADPQVAIYDSFADVFMGGIRDTGEDMGIYYISKDYTARRIAPTQSGKFTADGDYYYFIHEANGDSLLKRIDLKSDNFTSEKVSNDSALNMCVTQKGNVYFLDDNGSMRFHDASKGTTKKQGLGEDIGTMIFYDWGNTIYYTIADAEGEMKVYCSEEGSEKEQAKMDSILIGDIPTFTNPNSKRSYAYYYDENEASWLLFYTSNGSRFKLVSNDCQFDTFGAESPDPIG